MKRRHQDEEPQSGSKKQAKISDMFKPKEKIPVVEKKEEKRVIETNASIALTTQPILPLEKVHESWLPCFEQESSKPYYKKLMTFLDFELKNGAKIFPEPANVFSWASHCPADKVRVVILGQDPYHDDGQAHGLAFSVQKGVAPPPSLRNIWKELGEDLGISKPSHGCLEGWAKQGVLLLNTSLTVRAHQAASHSGQGWESFTDAIVEYVSKQTKNAVFLLWGGHAQKRAGKICKDNGHLVLQSAHPSPLSAHRGFFGCKHFSKANEYLEKNGHEPIDWSRSDL